MKMKKKKKEHQWRIVMVEREKRSANREKGVCVGGERWQRERFVWGWKVG